MGVFWLVTVLKLKTYNSLPFRAIMQMNRFEPWPGEKAAFECVQKYYNQASQQDILDGAGSGNARRRNSNSQFYLNLLGK